MKKLLISILSLAAVLVSCDSLTGGKTDLQQQNDSLVTVLNQRNLEFDNVMSLFNDINDGFRAISKAEGRVDLNRGSVMEGNNLTDQVKKDLEFITEKMQENRDKIAKLEKQIASANGQSSQLKKALESLKSELEEKSATIRDLQEELAQKNIRITELDEAVASLTRQNNDMIAQADEKNLTIAVQDKALNTAWFVFGTRKELREQNILTSAGLFRKDEVLKGDANLDYFTECDIRKTNEIKLFSSSADILTTHPAASYSLEKDAKGEMVLSIKDAASFWSVSRYLVIQVK